MILSRIPRLAWLIAGARLLRALAALMGCAHPTYVCTSLYEHRQMLCQPVANEEAAR